MWEEHPERDDALETARFRIAEQEQEIEQLRARIADQQLVQELRQAVTTLAASGTIARVSSHSDLLVLIVQTAAHVIDAEAGSVLLLDSDTRELVFEATATGDVHELKEVRIPPGEGIAGLVALTGQAMAVADAQTDPRHATEVAAKTGYMPRNLLCVPLIYKDEVIGVLELLDKRDAAGFDAADMEHLGLFAQQAAIAIEQSRTQQDLAALLQEMVASIGPSSSEGDRSERVRSFSAALQVDPAHRRSLELAELVREIAEHGEDETAACRHILEAFARYLRRRPGLGTG